MVKTNEAAAPANETVRRILRRAAPVVAPVAVGIAAVAGAIATALAAPALRARVERAASSAVAWLGGGAADATAPIATGL